MQKCNGATVTLLAAVLILAITGCSDNPANPPPVLNEHTIAAVFSSPEFQATQSASAELIHRARMALARGADRQQIHQALAGGDAERFYDLIGMSPQEVRALDERYFAAHKALLERFPELRELAASGESTCSATPEREASLFFERVDASVLPQNFFGIGRGGSVPLRWL